MQRQDEIASEEMARLDCPGHGPITGELLEEPTNGFHERIDGDILTRAKPRLVDATGPHGRKFRKNSPRKSTMSDPPWTRIRSERSCPSEPFADNRPIVPSSERCGAGNDTTYEESE